MKKNWIGLLLVIALGVSIMIATAQAEHIGDFHKSRAGVTPASLTGVVGDTFGVALSAEFAAAEAVSINGPAPPGGPPPIGPLVAPLMGRVGGAGPLVLIGNPFALAPSQVNYIDTAGWAPGVYTVTYSNLANVTVILEAPPVEVPAITPLSFLLALLSLLGLAAIAMRKMYKR